MNTIPTKVSKIEAARRQLDTAIDLYFSNADPVSIHTLAAASFEILRTLGLKSGIPKSNFDQILESAKQVGLEKSALQALRGPQNFFKHADRDAEQVLEFRIEGTLFFIFEATLVYQQLTKELPMAHKALRLWTLYRYPAIMKNHAADPLIESMQGEYSDENRLEFYLHFEQIQKVRAGG